MAKSSMLLCVGQDEGSLLPAPYLDSWGEEVRELDDAFVYARAVASAVGAAHQFASSCCVMCYMRLRLCTRQQVICC